MTKVDGAMTIPRRRQSGVAARAHNNASPSSFQTIAHPHTLDEEETAHPPSMDHCHEDEHAEIPISSMSRLAGQQVAPFLAKHIPAAYAPLGRADMSMASVTASRGDPNTKFCYRHHPDAKCRRTADESTMAHLQSVCTVGPIRCWC